VDAVTHGDARDPEQASGRLDREPLPPRSLDRLPAGELARGGRRQRTSIRGRLGRRAVVPLIGGLAAQLAGQRAAGGAAGDDAFVVGMAGEFGLDRAQGAGQRRGQAGGDLFAVVTDREGAVGSLGYLDPRAGIAGPLGAGQELDCPPAILDGVVPRSSRGQAPSDRARLAEGEDRAQVERQVERRCERAVSRLRVRRLDPEAGIEAG